jgi:hypothetical protein
MVYSTRPDATAKVIDIDFYQKNLNSSCLDIRLRKMWPGGTIHHRKRCRSLCGPAAGLEAFLSLSGMTISMQ